MEIVDGKWLFELLLTDVLDYICKKREMEKENVNISIMINQLNEILLGNILEITNKYKKVNIVTNHIEKFKKIEKKLFEEDGIMITVTNNKRKSLAKADIILNVDFPTELINKYNINENAIIVNLRGNVQIKSKRFNGLNINDYEIKFLNEENFDYEKIGKYDEKDIYEANIYQKQPYLNLKKQLKKDKVEIVKLITTKSTL